MEMIQSDRDCDKIRKKVLILSSVLFTVQGRKFFDINKPLKYPAWWSSGLSRHSNSSGVAAEDPGLNPAWGICMVP